MQNVAELDCIIFSKYLQKVDPRAFFSYINEPCSPIDLGPTGRINDKINKPHFLQLSLSNYKCTCEGENLSNRVSLLILIVAG